MKTATSICQGCVLALDGLFDVSEVVHDSGCLFDEDLPKLTHEQRVARIKALEQAGRLDVLQSLDKLLRPYVKSSD